MRITNRDREILRFINEVGYCTTEQLGRWFSIKMRRLYKVMERLIKAKLVMHERIYFNKPGIYFLTNQGAKFTSLPAIDKVSKGVFDHQLIMIDLILKLRNMYPDATWVSERHLKYQKFLYGVGRFGHISDGIFIFPDDRKVAIEVELTLKAKHRLEKILRAYGGQLEISEVWYFCNEDVMRGVAALSAKRSFVKIYSLKGFLHG